MRRLLIIVLSFATINLSFAQGAGSAITSSLIDTKSILKTNLVSYALLAVNANYEYKTGPATSVGLLAGYKLPTTITVDAIGELDGETMTYVGEIEPKGFYANPYFRFYTSGNAMTGFYMEAFLRYYDYEYLVPYEYEKDGRTILANLDGTANAFGGGISFGGQFSLSPRVYLDIYLGMGVGSGNIHVETNDPELDADDYQTIKTEIEENRDEADVQIFLLGNTLDSIEAGANDNSAWADIENQLFPMTRGGIAIGIGF
ncbi:MAG: DUF3575 domain-containing protein [Flavobacteriales bacterium]|nr:DUF3575 domain-containing protein [Flavobacteriales bacterium]